MPDRSLFHGADLVELAQGSYPSLAATEYLLTNWLKIYYDLRMQSQTLTGAEAELQTALLMLKRADLGAMHLETLLGFRSTQMHAPKPADNILSEIVRSSNTTLVAQAIAAHPNCTEKVASLLLTHPAFPVAGHVDVAQQLVTRGLLTPAAALCLRSKEGLPLGWFEESARLRRYTAQLVQPSKKEPKRDKVLRDAQVTFSLAHTWSGSPEQLRQLVQGIYAT